MIGFVVAGDPRDVGGYSGVPAGLLDGFDQAGVPVEPLRAGLPRPVQRAALNVLALALTRPADVPHAGLPVERLRSAVRSNKPRVHAGPWMAALRSVAVRARLGRHGAVSACVQFGSEYTLPAALRYVTYDDATIVQLAREYPYEWMQAVPRHELEGMVARQRRIYARAERCCVTNHWAAASAIGDYGVPAERIVVTGEGARPLARSLRRDWSAPRFLFVGKDWERKNGTGVLRAFARVREQRPDARLDVVGGHPRLDGPGITGHGLLPAEDPGARARLEDLLARSTCLVLPSLLEPSACVFAEALQAGTPAIGGIAGGSSTIIGDAGMVVDPTDDGAVAAAMIEMCDARTASSFAAVARSRAHLFTWRAVAERVLRSVAPRGVDTTGFALPL